MQNSRQRLPPVENPLAADAFPPARIEMLGLLSPQAAIAIDKARVYRRLQESLDRQVRLSDAQARFVPVEFLSSLHRLAPVMAVPARPNKPSDGRRTVVG